jgi:CDP-paratose 2-epimerase
MTGTSRPRALITGGAGFVATNVADHLLRAGWRVRLLDNLSRRGVAGNLGWLQVTHVSRGGAVEDIDIEVADVRDAAAVRRALKDVSRVFHFAAQVAVTTSLVDPVADFEINARGTLNLLEALRSLDDPPSLLFTSTNKVYGHLEDLRVYSAGKRYEPLDEGRRGGIAESQPLDFHSPYGCSKGAADQYVLDYARTFGLPATVFRMSCIYGPHQFGTEDQGWVAHFVIQALAGGSLTLYGDGLQVRDVLFVDDLVEAMMLAHDHIAHTSGQAFNIGGGVTSTLSLLELIDLIGGLLGRRPAYRIEPWRLADQRYYVSDTTKFERLTGWHRRVTARDGVSRLMRWVTNGSLAGRALQTEAAS